MEISPNIEIIETSLWLKEEKILIVNDFHLGYEEALQQKGILVPKFQLQEIIIILLRIFRKVKPLKIIINGDLKHEFGKMSSQEWKEVRQLLDFLRQHSKEIIIVRGHHDLAIRSFAEKKEDERKEEKRVKIVAEYHCGDTLIIHGDELVETTAQRIIIGHEHPAITLRAGGKWEKYKCFLKGRWNEKEIIAVPSFNPLIEGTDILKEETLSPFLKDLDPFEVFIINAGEIFSFGEVRGIRDRNNGRR